MIALSRILLLLLALCVQNDVCLDMFRRRRQESAIERKAIVRYEQVISRNILQMRINPLKMVLLELLGADNLNPDKLRKGMRTNET